MHPVLRAAGGAAALGVGGLAYAGLVERNAYALRRFDMPVLPVGAAPIRVLHFSDLHLMPAQRRKVRWVRDLARLEPHIVVNTGDNIAHPESIEPLLHAMEPHLDLPGAFVLGSNDYFEPGKRNPVDYLRRRVAKLGARQRLFHRRPTARWCVAPKCGCGMRRGAFSSTA